MTIIDAKTRFDRRHPENKVEHSDIILWLDSIDSVIYNEIILNHEEPIEWSGYGELTDYDTFLLADDGYDVLYDHYLDSEYYNLIGEITKYNNSTAAFNAAYQRYANHYNHNNMPKQRAKIKF